MADPTANPLPDASEKTAVPGQQPRTSTNPNTRHHCRRKERQKLHIFSVIGALPEPFGIAARSSYLPLDAWRGAHDDSSEIVDWATMPPALDPCAMLNPLNMSKKHGVPVQEQIAMLQFNPGAELATQNMTSAELPTQNMSKKEAAKAAKALTNAKGQDDKAFSKDRRGIQKRWQVESFVVILRRMLGDAATVNSSGSPFRILDFGCGTGAVLLPLAYLFPHCEFVGVEMKATALTIMQQRLEAAGLTNVKTHVGMIEDYKEPFDVGLAL
eukprot:gene6670-3335_t